MNIEFHPEAAEEFEAAVDWYEVRKIGLGLDCRRNSRSRPSCRSHARRLDTAFWRCSRRIGQPLSLWCSVRIEEYVLARAGRDALAT